MKFREIFQFELKYQLQSPSTWLYLAICGVIPFLMTLVGEPADEGTYLNAPAFLILATVFASVIWLLAAGAIAGHAAARDVQERMHPLVYTSPVSKAEYLGGRFLAAFMLNALMHLAIPLSFILSFAFRDIDPALLAPFRPEVYLTTYFYLSLPLTFVVTACQFSVSVLERKAITAYIVSILLFPIISQLIGTSIANQTGKWELARLIDLVGTSIVAGMEAWTPHEENTRTLGLEGTFLWNRLMWLGIATVFLGYAYFRFGFSHPSEKTSRSIFRRRQLITEPLTVTPSHILIPRVIPVFGINTSMRQVWAIALSSFRAITKSKGFIALAGLLALHFVVFGNEYLTFRGVPQYPMAMNVLTLLTSSLRDIRTPLVVLPILIVYYAGELVSREREAGVNKISDTLPVSEWVLFLGKFSGLALTIAMWLALLLVAGILVQIRLGYNDLGIDVFVKALFGLQLANYLLFALAALVIHAVVNQKYPGHFVVLIFYLYMVFSAKLGIEHNLLIYASDPGWSYTDMRGFGPYTGPWLWFKLYWTGWAILLAVVARLLWVRSMSDGTTSRLQLARERFTGKTASITVVSVAIILISGGYIFYNTNILNEYITVSEGLARQARYELAYSKYEHLPQPFLTGTKLQVELYPSKRKADIRATYKLVNKHHSPIDSIHFATVRGLETGAMTFDRPASAVLEDHDLGHRIYKLDQPLLPGDSISLSFDIQLGTKGFPHKGIDVSVIENGTYFINYDVLPTVGYQSLRELKRDGERLKYGLGPKTLSSPYDSASRQITPLQELIDFEAVIGTEEGQIAITAGKQIRQWKESFGSGQNGRNYFHYVASAPIKNTYSFFSARYAEREEKWTDPQRGGHEVVVKTYYHPGHAQNIDRIMQSARSALGYYSKQFGPYPYDHLTIIERSGYNGYLNAESTTIDYGEGFTFSNQNDNPRALDVTYFAIAHEVAHQWWGAAQVIPAHTGGALLISETLANYCGLRVLEEKYGMEQVRMLLSMWRDSYEVPRSRLTTSLLHATDAFLGYRKGPLALYALAQYTDGEHINQALQQLLLKRGSGQPPLPTSLDLYSELQAVTPDSLSYFLQDYFEKNIYWELKTTQATAKQIDSGNWQVTLRLHAKKITVDSTGAEVPVSMDDWIEIGVFAPWESGERSGKTLYLKKHRVRTGEQTLTITVPGRPGRAGIDPSSLLIDLNWEDNTRIVKIEDESDMIQDEG